MSDNNRLEYDIVANNETDAATAKVRANYRSIDEQAAKSSASISASYEAASASVLRSIQSLEQRAVLAGKTGVDKLVAQKQILIDRAASDEAAINRITNAYDRLITAQQRLDKASSTKQAGISAGKATLSGEADFQSALRAVQSRDAEIKLLEQRAQRATLSKPDFLRSELGGLLSQRGVTDSAAERYRTAYASLIKAAEEEEKHSGGHGSGSSMVLRRGFLGLKDAWEGRTQGTVIEAADILMGTSGGGGILPGVVSSLGEMTGLGSTAVIAIGSVAAAFGGLQLAGFGAMKSLAEYGQEVQNIHLRTGIAAENVEQFAFAAKMGGQDVGVFEKMMRGLSEAENDNSSSGTKARAEMSRLGISLRDATGQMKPTEQVLVELSAALGKIPPGAQRDAAAMEIFKRVGIEAIPVISGLADNVKKAKDIGLGATKEDLDRWEEYHRKITEAGAMWDNFVRRIKGVLAATVIIAFEDSSGKTLHPDDLRKMGVNPRYAGSDSSGLSAQTQVDRSVFPGATSGGIDLKGIGGYADQVAAYNRKKADFAKFEQSPEQQLGVAEDQLRAIGKPSVDNLAEYRAAYDRVQRLKAADKASKDNAQDLVAAGKERQQLLAESAQIAESSQLKDLSASLDTKKELSSPEDIVRLLDLAKRRSIADENKIINDHRDTNGAVSAQFLDQENANLQQRIENEQSKVLADISAKDAQYFRARTDADGKAWEQAWERRKKGEMDLQQEEINTRQQIQTHQFDIDGQSIDRQREMALQGLDAVDAQTLQQKIALEDRKLAIEQSYAERSLANQVAKLQNEEVQAIAAIQKQAAENGDTGTTAEAAAIAAKKAEYDQKIGAVQSATSDREIIDAQKAQSAKEKLAIESNKRVYDSLKHDAEGLFDQLVSHTKSWGDFAKDLFKSAILTPVKDIFSSQVAGLFTGLLTGQKVTFGEVGNGQGTFGKLGSIFGRAGLGQPKFGDQNHPLAKLNAPNHLGDVSLISGAVPVVILNSAQVGQAHANAMDPAAIATRAVQAAAPNGWRVVPFKSQAAEGVQSQAFDVQSTWQPLTSADVFDGAGITSGFNDLIMSGARNSPLQGFAQSTWSPVAALSPNGFPTMGELAGLGTPSGIFSSAGDNPWVLPTPPPFVDQGLSGVQLADWANPNLGVNTGFVGNSPESQAGRSSLGPFGNLVSMLGGGKGGLFGGLKGMFGLDTAGTDIGNGIGIARTGLGGNLAAISKSGGFAMLGGGLALDGIRRGGVVGTLEAAGGGAAVGFKYGGFLGAGIGAAIGGGLALAKTFGLFDGDRKHAKKLVKQVYGMDINNATADQIVAIAKQSFGNQIDVAVRSPQVRDLLRIYSQAHGDKKAEDKFVQDSVHSASFSESGGKLFQNAVYDNGNAYSYASSLPTYGGVTTAPLSTYQPNQGVFSGNLSINLNGQSAADVLEGRVANVVTPGFVQGQALSASSSSNGRTAQQNMTLSPTALTR